MKQNKKQSTTTGDLVIEAAVLIAIVLIFIVWAVLIAKVLILSGVIYEFGADQQHHRIVCANYFIDKAIYLIPSYQVCRDDDCRIYFEKEIRKNINLSRECLGVEE